MKKKVIVILGPTAVGKTSLSIKLAKQFNGEIVSADSRQIYRGLDIGTGKVTKREMGSITHYMLDIVDPETRFSVASYKKRATKEIRDILSRNKTPILCGGTGFYISSIIDNSELPNVPPNNSLRSKLEKLDNQKLFEKLEQLDTRRAYEIDKNNRPRLIRAIEIAIALGYVPQQSEEDTKFDFLIIGLVEVKEVLQKKINKRLEDRLGEGLTEEIESLHKKGLSYKRLDELGLEYRYIAKYLQGKLSKERMIEKLKTEIWRYAKRQKTWFRRDKRIKWFKPDQFAEIQEEVEKFIK